MKIHAALLAALLGLSGVTGAESGSTVSIEQVRDEAAAQYRYKKQLVEALARSSDPMDLMTAARFHPGSRPVLSHMELTPAEGHQLQQARRALVAQTLHPSAPPAVWWRAATDCAKTTEACDRAAAIAQLREIDADNGAVWLFLESPDDNAANLDARLERAAAASRFNAYFGDWLRQYLKAFELVPVPDEILTDSDLMPGGEVTASDVRFVAAMGLAMADVIPGYTFLAETCRDRTDAALSPERKALCRRVLRQIVEHSDTIASQQVAARRLIDLVEGTERDALLKTIRQIRWQMDAFVQITIPSEDEDPSRFRQTIDSLITAWRQPDASELEVTRAVLLDANIPLAPPAEWNDSLWGATAD